MPPAWTRDQSGHYNTLHVPFGGGPHGTGTEGLVVTFAQEAFEVFEADPDSVPEVAQARLFDCDHVLANLALHRVGQTVENEFFRHAPD